MFFSFHRTPFRTFGKRNEKFASIIKNILRTLKLVTYGEAYENLRVETVSAFRYIKHAVVSCVPEGDAINRVRSIARHCGVDNPRVIGWDFQFDEPMLNVLRLEYNLVVLVYGHQHIQEI